MKETILIASANKAKVAELKFIAKKLGVTVVAPYELKLSELALAPEVPELGKSYLENARLKGLAFSAWASMPALADDSGLELDAFDGWPGIYSARCAGEGASDAKRNQLVLEKLVGKRADERNASFRCALVLVFPDGRERIAEGELSGQILESPRGEDGFGYDTIFKPRGSEKSLAELSFEEKCSIGFRASAMRVLFESKDSA